MIHGFEMQRFNAGYEGLPNSEFSASITFSLAFGLKQTPNQCAANREGNHEESGEEHQEQARRSHQPVKTTFHLFSIPTLRSDYTTSDSAWRQ